MGERAKLLKSQKNYRDMGIKKRSTEVSRMIHLDTNALIALPVWARGGHALIERIAAGEPVSVCAVVWYEFTSGPVSAEEINLALTILGQRVIDVARRDAELAARLYNQAGRRRVLKTDALIAACAIHANAEFATLNGDDFLPFVSGGLQLYRSDLR